MGTRHDNSFQSHSTSGRHSLLVRQKFAPLINRGGAVVLTTSIANAKGMAGNATYGAAKAALRSFARTLAAELIPREIRVDAGGRP